MMENPRTGLAFIISQCKTVKISGRRRIRFHMDQLVFIQKVPNRDEYFWLCRMGEVEPHDWAAGVMCLQHGFGYHKQIDAEEAALGHLVNVHRAMGGERLPPNRGRARRIKKLEAWNERRRAEQRRREDEPD